MIVVAKVSSVLVGDGDDDRIQCLRKWGRLMPLLNLAVEWAMEPEKRTLGAGLDALGKLVALHGQADKDLAAATPQQRLLVRRGLAITALMVKSVCAVAPPEAQADTWVRP